MNTIYDKMLEVAHTAATVPGLKSILKPIYYPIKELFEKHRNKIFRKNALTVIAEFDKCMSDNGFKYFLAFGSMLGAVREHGFIKHDLDIDTAMWNSDYSLSVRNALEQAGFYLDQEFLVEDGKKGREQTYTKNGVAIDVFFFYPPFGDSKLPYCCDFISWGDKAATHNDSMKKYGRVLARRLELPLGRDVIKVPFENLSLPILKNAKDFLEYRYGSNYMIPNPNWGISSYDEHITKWPEVKAIFKKY